MGLALAVVLATLAGAASGGDATAQRRGGPALAGFGFGQAPDAPGGYTLLLAAHHWPDGTVEGRYELEEGGVRYRGDVTCLAVVGDVAYAGGPVYEVDGHTVEYAGIFVFAIAGGEPQRLGRRYDPQGYGPWDRIACFEAGPLLATHPLVRGEFAVRP
jgi:hypothetical protein